MIAAMLVVLAARGAELSDREALELIKVGPGDSVRIEVFGQPNMTTTVFVAEDGRVSVPLAGQVSVTGLSPVDAGTRIEQALKTGGFLNDPHVTVTLLQSRTAHVSVLGKVGHPGPYPVDPHTTLFALLAQAGGVVDDGADVGYVLRPDGHGGVERFPVSLGRSEAAAMETVRGGDTLYVPRADQFYILGEVASPNMYRLEPGMTVLQAIARAGGITQRGSERRIEIKRKQTDGRELVIHPKVSDPVLPNDVIRVKESIF
jgi:polysaccharide export outer membrane protein